MDPAAGALQSSDDTVRIAALHALTESSLRHPDIRADVRVALLSPSSVVRRAALVCWQRTGCGPDDDVRAGMLHRDREVRIAALNAVCSWGADEALGACRIALRDSHDDVVRVALLMLSMQHLPIEPELLLSHLADENQMIAIKTAVLLAERGHADGEAAVAGYLTQTDSPAFSIVVRLIGAVGLTRYGAVLQAQLHPHHPYLAVLVQALGRLAEPSAIRPILSYLAHHNDQIRSTAVQALIAMNDQRIVPALRGATADCRAYVRNAATWVLLGLDATIEPQMLRNALSAMRQNDAELLLKRWLTGPCASVVARVVTLHEETEWCESNDARACVRRFIAEHPDARAVRMELHLRQNPHICLTLLPYYSEGELPLLSVDILVRILADDRLRKGSRMRVLADVHIRRDPESLRVFWPHADESFHQYYGEHCLLTMQYEWQALIWQTRSAVLHRRFLRLLATLIRVAPGYVAHIPAAGIEWLQACTDRADFNLCESLTYVQSFWEAHQPPGSAALAPADPYESASVFAGWAGSSPGGIARRIVQRHDNPLVPITPELRVLFRTLIATHPDGDQVCAIVHAAQRPTIAVTLIPWYVNGVLPAVSTELYALMMDCCDTADRTQLHLMTPAVSLTDAE